MPAPVLTGKILQITSAKTLIDVQHGLKFARSPRWVRHMLLILDAHDASIKSAALDGAVNKIRTLPFVPGSFSVKPNGELVVGDAWRRKIYRLAAADLNQIADLSAVTGTCLSECVTDNCGGMYVGDVGFDFQDPSVDPAPNGAVIYINSSGKSSVVAGDLFFPCGMIVTKDNSTLIVAEALAHRLTSFKIKRDGSLQDRRVWAQLEDDVRPNGICLDSDGAIWVAGAGRCALRVLRYGEISHRVTTQQPVFANVLGGPERRHLFMCTSLSQDPVITRRDPSATIDVAEVACPGVNTALAYES